MRYFILICALLALTGCVSPKKKGDMDIEALRQAWLTQQDKLSRITKWQIDGRAAVSTEDDSGTVSLFWDQGVEEFKLKLVAPFGRGTLAIESDDRGVVMLDPKGKEHRAATAQGLIWLKTGWEIPIEDMRAWVLGIVPDPTDPTVRVDESARTLAFQSGDWSVTYPAYKTVKTAQGEMELPRKVYIKSDNLSVKLVVSEWELN